MSEPNINMTDEGQCVTSWYENVPRYVLFEHVI